MDSILFSKTHEYIYEKDGFFYIGASGVLLDKLGIIRSVTFPETGGFYTKGEIFGYLESDNAASELFMPVSGKIEAVNSILKDNLNLFNTQSFEENWLIKISPEFYNQDKTDLAAYNEYKEGNK